MAEGKIIRKGGAVTAQALAPTITEVSTTFDSITFTITNNDASTAVILYEVGDTTPDSNSIELAAAATSSNLTISGLSPGTITLYATANVTGKVKSNVTEKEFTLIQPFIEATGGTTEEYDSGGKRFKSHTFTSSGTFTVTNVGTSNEDRNKVDYLIIAGGAGGGLGNGGGGGGAGGYRTTLGTSGANSSAESKVVVTAQGYTITIGAGGAKAVFPSGDPAATSGFNTSALGITSTGGGKGGQQNDFPGSNGGSGGGGGSPSDLGNTSTGGSGTANQGTNGGNGSSLSSVRAGGGGGGAGQAGFNNASTSVGGNGGNGLANLLRTGSNETRAGGGGGGSNAGTGSSGTGGSGGGGNATTSSAVAQNGVINSGSGGGGGGSNAVAPGGNYSSGAGGSGIVVIRYEIPPSV